MSSSPKLPGSKSIYSWCILAGRGTSCAFCSKELTACFRGRIKIHTYKSNLDGNFWNRQPDNRRPGNRDKPGFKRPRSHQTMCMTIMPPLGLDNDGAALTWPQAGTQLPCAIVSVGRKSTTLERNGNLAGFMGSRHYYVP